VQPSPSGGRLRQATRHSVASVYHPIALPTQMVPARGHIKLDSKSKSGVLFAALAAYQILARKPN